MARGVSKRLGEDLAGLRRCLPRPLDGRALAAWSPDWLVETGGWPEAEVLAEYLGSKNVLRTHPFSDTQPARLTTEVTVPAGGGSLTGLDDLQ